MLNSTQLFSKAQTLIPGGVNSPVRAFKNVDQDPPYFKQGQGPYLIDVDENRYIDFINSWGCLILGHAHPKVIQSVNTSLQQGLGFGACTPIEVDMAEKIQQLMPSIEMVRMVNSGTEATQSAIRLARGFTQRNKIIKFAGCYHGHCDSLLSKSGSGVLTLGIPDSAGIPNSFTEHTLIAPYNDIDSVQQLFSTYGEDIAGVIIEPIAGNMGFIRSRPEFLTELRTLCDDYQSLLIFDEVMSGFRVAQGGAQALYGITPDLSCLGKIIGGGLPVGAFGGRKDIMEQLAPLGPIYQAGTLSGNPIALTAGLATLQELSSELYEVLALRSKALITGLSEIATEHGIPFQGDYAGGMFGFFFNKQPVHTFADVKHSNLNHFKQFFSGMFEAGILFAPSAFEAGFLSSAHTEDIISETLDAAKRVFKRLV